MLKSEKLDYYLSLTVRRLALVFLILYMFKSFLYGIVDKSINNIAIDSDKISIYKKITNNSYIDYKNIEWLAKNNYYESRGVAGQDFVKKREDMKNVSQVVLNRLNSKRFGRTIEKVITYKNPTSGICHFSWVCQKNLKKIDYKSPEWNLAYEVAFDTYLGLGDNEIGETALHYYNPLQVKPKWSNDMTKVAYVKTGHIIIE